MKGSVRRWFAVSLVVSVLTGGTGVVHGQAVTAPAKLATLTPRQREWLAASPYERVRLAERLGEEGARAFAKRKGWTVISDGLEKVVPQGPDQVYRAADGTVHVIEAKGGSGQLGRAYGHAQGSAEWAIESSKRILRSAKAGLDQKRGARYVLQEASRGKMEVHVVRTPHVRGEPGIPKLEQTVRTTRSARRAATNAMDNLARLAQRSAGSASKSARRAVQVPAKTTGNVARGGARAGGRALRYAAKGAVVVGAAVDAGLRVQEGVNIERQYRAGKISQQQREVCHAKNAAGMAGGWGGAAGGAWIAGQAAAPIAAACGPAAPYVEGGAIVVGGVAGYVGGEKAAEAAVGFGVRRVHAAGTTISDAAADGAVMVRDAAYTAGKSIRGTWNWAWGQ